MVALTSGPVGSMCPQLFNAIVVVNVGLARLSLKFIEDSRRVLQDHTDELSGSAFLK